MIGKRKNRDVSMTGPYTHVRRESTQICNIKFRGKLKSEQQSNDVLEASRVKVKIPQ